MIPVVLTGHLPSPVERSVVWPELSHEGLTLTPCLVTPLSQGSAEGIMQRNAAKHSSCLIPLSASCPGRVSEPAWLCSETLGPASTTHRGLGAARRSSPPHVVCCCLFPVPQLLCFSVAVEKALFKLPGRGG